MLNVSQLARQCGLSRTAVLYYESMGLLKPSFRSAANYRCYGEKEVAALKQICLYRSVGLSVRDIHRMLSAPKSGIAGLLKRRLVEIDSEISELRTHQKAILGLLQSKTIVGRDKDMTKEKWVAIMRAAGLTEENMHRWHHEFERAAPQDHEEFLKFLHIPDEEVRTIRKWSREEDAK